MAFNNQKNTYEPPKKALKIPFSEEEIYKCLEKRILERLNNLEKLIGGNKFFEFNSNETTLPLMIGAEGEDDYFLFKPISNPNDDFYSAGGFDIPKINQLEALYTFFKKDKNSSSYGKSGIGFYADRDKKSVYIRIKDNNWEKQEELIRGFVFYPVTTCILSKTKDIKKLLLSLLKWNIKPAIFNSVENDFVFIHKVCSNLAINNAGSWELHPSHITEKDIPGDMLNEIYKELLSMLHLDVNSLSREKLDEYLLTCEKTRCAMAPYPLEKLNSDTADYGLWNFWVDDYDTVFGVPITAEEYARNPYNDVSHDEPIGIDFGTKSTVVVKKDNKTNQLMQINIGPGAGEKDYENPTLMQLFDLDRFMTRYRMKKGRPNTEWIDLMVANPVQDKITGEAVKDCDISTILYQIKQWAADSNRIKVVKPGTDKSVIPLLPLENSINTTEFNPIEIYAYFIGLYLNNRRDGNKIYENYYMTYPATLFNAVTKEYVRKSFEKGLKKSIPDSVLNRDDFKLSVKMDFSEPEAYAVCALETLGFEADEGQPIRYAIFDFGGGTSDYAYGEWTKRGKKYELKTIMTTGDKYLGGENLLEGLAFEIFSEEKNFKNLSDNDCHFPKAALSTNYSPIIAGFINDYLPAKKNMRVLVEALRPYWENSKVNLESEISEKVSKKYVLSSANAGNASVTLSYTTGNIKLYLSEEIKKGIDGFFAALEQSFFAEKDEEGELSINILLAGNSSKSSIFQTILKDRIAIEEKALSEKYNKQVKLYVFSPLGTEEVGEEMRSLLMRQAPPKDESSRESIELKINNMNNDNNRPTGKTGAAFGLQMLKQYKIDVVHPDVDNFGFWLGDEEKVNGQRLFKPFKFNANNYSPCLGQWYLLDELDNRSLQYTIKYTNNPICLTGKMPFSRADTKTINFRHASRPGDRIFINPQDLGEIIWVVAKDENEAYEKAKKEIDLDRITITL